MKTRTTLILIAMLFTLTFCGKKDTTSEVEPPKASIHIAAIQGNLKAIEQHIAAGTDLDIKEPRGGSTALITAASFGKTEVAKALIKGGADLNLKNNDGSTALITAAFFCHTEIVEALLKHNADQSIANNRGSTALATVIAPFENVKPIYEVIEKAMSPLGLQLDYERIEKTRPVIAEMLD